MEISVVIPTYNRIEQLSDVLDHLLKSEVEGFSNIEIIVVDDGSSVSPESMILNKQAAKPFVLKYEQQQNAGPARARNNGYRKATCSIVLFLDDDVLVSPRLLRHHVEAHKAYPSSVIIGSYFCLESERSLPSSRYVLRLEHAANNLFSDSDFVEINTVNSGNLSIEREMFQNENGLYDDDLNSPTAEEFDVIAKLRRRKIPVYLGKRLSAVHLQSTSIAETCKREYKHAVGIGELSVKMPRLAEELNEVKNFLVINQTTDSDLIGMRLKKNIKRLLSKKAVRALLVKIVSSTEKILPFDTIMFPLFRAVIGINIFAGVNDGKQKFEAKSA